MVMATSLYLRVAFVALCALFVVTTIRLFRFDLTFSPEVVEMETLIEEPRLSKALVHKSELFFEDHFTKAKLPIKLARGIRSWGCNRTESPLTFVHIGKAGMYHKDCRLLGV